MEELYEIFIAQCGALPFDQTLSSTRCRIKCYTRVLVTHQARIFGHILAKNWRILVKFGLTHQDRK